MDTDAFPKTEPYVPTFDTGVHHKAEPEPSATRRRWWRRRSDPSDSEIAEEPPGGRDPAEAAPKAQAPTSGPLHAPVPPTAVPGRYHYLRWWQFVLVVAAVWVPAGAIGAGLFYWWIHDRSAHKTPVVFVVLVYVVVCVLAGLMLAMVPDRALLSALGIAMLSAVFASVIAAAPLYGAFYCDHIQGQCLLGLIPY
ncbi:hypothetical protein [Candidatus Mycobacterium methanotrophicum]|uniref:Transmembrane protein n=1 Tax=Candidatus Mycobacterium methanotrophicum TaxID=2943498 RepID=A0ABY4QM68_9MYCO|nr:hypothetical protein [Candidatus Mycobacterium methanotrophicum]UQX11969.1 hypothetical protein M5I08_06305 [Candidatus Mycobacterium methanotrophicum]